MRTIRLCFFLSFLCCINSLFAQNDELGNGLIFPQFEKGTVVFKDGTRFAASLNYSMLQQEMLFQDENNSIMAIATPSEIVVIIIGERRFFPTSSKCIFYEEIQTGTSSFFIERKANILSEGKGAGYGGYSQTSSITSYASYQNSYSSQIQKLSSDEKFRLKTESFYYLKSGNSYKKFSSAKTLGKLFKGQESKIEAYAKEQSINFAKNDDIARIVEYGYSLMNK